MLITPGKVPEMRYCLIIWSCTPSSRNRKITFVSVAGVPKNPKVHDIRDSRTRPTSRRGPSRSDISPTDPSDRIWTTAETSP
jgi:hypothetical protein